MIYASFWQRFAALWIDVLVLSPLNVVLVWLSTRSSEGAIALLVAQSVVYPGYAIYCHGRYAQTVGKWWMGIRLVRTTGENVGWREAWLRGAPAVLFAGLAAIGRFSALTASDGATLSSDFLNAPGQQAQWLGWADVAGWIWTVSEVVVMMTNKRRRALHDFIAGTLVVVAKKSSR